MYRHPLASLLAILLVALAAPLVHAAERCAMSCRAEVAACKRSECGRERGAARRDCIETHCRGPLGCPARIRTLAYVVSRCRAQDGRLVGGQELQIRRGDCDPVTVLPLEYPGETTDPLDLCGEVVRNRAGHGSVLAGVFQRLGVTPDGSGVVFEVTPKFQLIGKAQLAPEQQGFFYVRADGSGLHHLGPPSGDKTYRIISNPITGKLGATFQTYLPFSPSGRLVAYTDVGPAPDGHDATQIFTLDVATGQRTQVTRLPLDVLPVSYFNLRGQVFLDEQTIRFLRTSDSTLYTIRTDGSGMRAVQLPQIPELVPTNPVPALLFGVAQPIGLTMSLELVARTDKPIPSSRVVEVFRFEGKNALQLTDFGRSDTFVSGSFWDTDPNFFVNRGRVLLLASTNSLGENPHENCQLFSLGPWGGGLRQLTSFEDGLPSQFGCYWARPGCAFSQLYQDPVTRWIIFYSSCHPFDVNFNGSQVFAMRPDGRRLRQLTHTAGARWVGDEVEVEIPGPIAYSMPIR